MATVIVYQTLQLLLLLTFEKHTRIYKNSEGLCNRVSLEHGSTHRLFEDKYQHKVTTYAGVSFSSF